MTTPAARAEKIKALARHLPMTADDALRLMLLPDAAFDATVSTLRSKADAVRLSALTQRGRIRPASSPNLARR